MIATVWQGGASGRWYVDVQNRFVIVRSRRFRSFGRAMRYALRVSGRK